MGCRTLLHLLDRRRRLLCQSLIHFIKKLYNSLSRSVTQDIYLQITDFIKKYNPNPIGLCGIMFPCLEDFELAQEYEQGNFSIERNIYLSLHSGLGIDTYPVGLDEPPKRVFDILCLLQGLSKKYSKPLSARFISDGFAKIGEKTDDPLQTQSASNPGCFFYCVIVDRV